MYRKEILDDMRGFAEEISPDFGPLFGRDVVSLVDDFLTIQAENDLAQEALEFIAAWDRDEEYILVAWDVIRRNPDSYRASAIAKTALAQIARRSPGADPVVTETPEKGANPHDD